MIGQIARKDILGSLLSLRFVLSLLLLISLSATSGFVFLDEFRQQSEDFRSHSNEYLSALRGQTRQLYRLAFHWQRIYRKPKPLTFFAEGFEQYLPNCIDINVFLNGLPQAKQQCNFLLPQFIHIDWVFLTSLILSFVALLLTYDCICGEKEGGTLRLMLAGSVPRHKILAAKYLSAMFTAGIPLLVGLLVGLIIVVVSREVVFGAGDWLKILALVVLAFVYVSIFVLLGILISSRTAHSANSMVMLLLVWVGLVILIPSLGRVITEITSKGSNPQKCQRRVKETTKQVDAEMNAGKFGPKAGKLGSLAESNPPARARYINALTDAENRVIEDCHNQMLAQAFAGRNYTCISPAAVYRRASEAIAGTGINHCVSLYEQIKRYQAQLRDYIRDEDREDPNSLHLLFDEVWPTKSWNAISKRPVSFDAVPKFQEGDLALGQSLKLAIWDIGLLVLFNLVFFAASFVSFLRYDVR
ncbi:MAG: ABC transporter permease subunit [Desulfatiglandales bacterium]